MLRQAEVVDTRKAAPAFVKVGGPYTQLGCIIAQDDEAAFAEPRPGKDTRLSVIAGPCSRQIIGAAIAVRELRIAIPPGAAIRLFARAHVR